MSTSQPVIVLVHGAWADASSWSSVLSELQDRGFTVYAPPNPLRGLPQDSAYVHQFLTQNAALQGQSVVLVAHSYGGAVITNAAVGAPGVRGPGVRGRLHPRSGRYHRRPGQRGARILPGQRGLHPGALPRRTVR